jgi:hypothetical protein
VTARSADSAILEALAQLELKLTALITTGLAQIKDDHSKALLDQARLNASFASREVVEALRSQVDRNTAEIISLSRAEDRAYSGTARHAGYLIAGAFSFGAVLLSVLLNHLL